MGAAIGTAIAGPIGMIAGYKVAAVACLGSAAAGYIGGKAVERRTAPAAITQSEDALDEGLVDEVRVQAIDKL